MTEISSKHKEIFEEIESLIWKCPIYVKIDIDEEYMSLLKSDIELLKSHEFSSHEKRRFFRILRFVKNLEFIDRCHHKMKNISTIQIKGIERMEKKYTIKEIYEKVKNDDFSIFFNEKDEVISQDELMKMIKPSSIARDMGTFTKMMLLFKKRYPKVMKEKQVQDVMKRNQEDFSRARQKIKERK